MLSTVYFEVRFSLLLTQVSAGVPQWAGDLYLAADAMHMEIRFSRLALSSLIAYLDLVRNSQSLETAWLIFTSVGGYSSPSIFLDLVSIASRINGPELLLFPVGGP